MSALRAIGICMLLSISATAFSQTSDTTPPELIAFDFNPKNIDVTLGVQNVTITAEAIDDLSGPSSLLVTFTSPSRAQQHTESLRRTQVTPLNSTYSDTLEIPQFVESGTWTVLVQVFDRVSNRVQLESANLAALGFPNELVVDSVPDATPPSLTGTVLPVSIDVSNSDQVITLDLHLTDDLSGLDISRLSASIDSPGRDQRYVIPDQEFTLISGTEFDQVQQVMWTIPQHSKAGIWNIRAGVSDNGGNHGSSSNVATFDVISSTEDVSPPVLTNFSFSPLVINTSEGSANVTVSLNLTDDLTGVDFSTDSQFGGFANGVVRFSAPSTSQSRNACCSRFDLTSGTVLNGTWEASIFFPQFSEQGTWQAELQSITDHVRNRLNMRPDALEAAGFAAGLVVVKPSLVGDGSVDEGGGTVVDEAFPDRAKVTFPPGAVAGDTDVAIDVFPDPLAIPNPEGFQGPGTFFVNISLTPEQNQPFPPPGVTLTLPLPNFINPGSAIPLYFVDPDTGLLVPMPDPNGDQVIGTVNADGLSASFFGITHFSIVVGLVPATVDDVVARAKSGKVSLLWSAIPDALSYNIYRSETAGGPYDLIAANHMTSFATYLDTTVTNDTTYYYIVTVVGDGFESNESNEAEVTVSGRSRRR